MRNVLTFHRPKKKPDRIAGWLFILIITAVLTGVAAIGLAMLAILPMTSLGPEPTRPVLILVPTQIRVETPTLEPVSLTASPEATATSEQATSVLYSLPTAPSEIVMTATAIWQPLPTSTSFVDPTDLAPFQAATATLPSTSWRGEYFNNPNLMEMPAAYRDDMILVFDWGTNAPLSVLPADAFSVRWQRMLPFTAGSYRFYVRSDDGVRIWIDDLLLIDQWHDASNTTYTADVTLAAGSHNFRVEYYDIWGDAEIRFWWEAIDQFPQWRAEYFDNAGLYGTAFITRNDPDINYNWERVGPALGIPADGFSVRWTRSIEFADGIHRFHALVDDGIRLYINDALVLNEWFDGGLREVTADALLTAGPHHVRIEYYDNIGEARIHVWWEKVSTQSYPDWRGAYWTNRQLAGQPALIRNDFDVDFDWGSGAPDSRLPADNFSARWSRTVRLEEGMYRFRTLADDGIRLYVDGSLIIDDWQDGRAREVTRAVNLSTGNHSLLVDYYDHGGDARVRVWWDRIGPATYADWKGEYWNNRLLSGRPTFTRNDSEIDFEWKGDGPSRELGIDDFSVRWSRQINLNAGIHRIYAQADDGVRVYVDGKLVIDQWRDSDGSQTFEMDVALTAGLHQLVIEYYENQGDARIRVWRERVGDLPTPTVSPTSTALPRQTPTAHPPLVTPTATQTSTVAPPQTSTPTETVTATPTATPTPTGSPSPTNTPTETPAPTLTPTITPRPVPAPQTVGLSEVLALPSNIDWNCDGQVNVLDVWVELRNAGNNAVNLNGWHLEIDNGEDNEYWIPARTTIRSSTFLVFFPLYTDIGPGNGWTIRLINRTGRLVDQVTLPVLAEDASYSRDINGTWHEDWPPSPGSPNLPVSPAPGSPAR